MAENDIIRLIPPDINDIATRLERLEELAWASGKLMLFWLEAHNANFIVVAPDVETAMMLVPNQGNVEFLGRASTQYDKPQIIKIWPCWNWNEVDHAQRNHAAK